MKNDVSWLDVLELCLKPFMAQIFQASGAIHIRRIRSLRSTNRPELWSSVPTTTGPKRLPVTLLWNNKCNIRGSAELELLQPYKTVEISMDDSKDSDVDKGFYRAESWSNVIYPTSYYLKGRVVFGTPSAV